MNRPLIIAHRGASGYRPEHSAPAYELAIAQGADFLETDVVLTRDGHLVCRHDCELSRSSNVADHPEFAARRATKAIEHQQMTGWFVEDFTLAEIRTLRTRQPVASRDHSFDGQFPLLTLSELLELAADAPAKFGRTIGLIIEIKHATYFQSLGLSMETAVVRTLADFAAGRKSLKLAIESFEIGILKRLRQSLALPIYQLIDLEDMPIPDVDAAGRQGFYRDLITPSGLAEIQRYADGISVNKPYPRAASICPGLAPSNCSRRHRSSPTHIPPASECTPGPSPATPAS
jgi:glycerophosphoryl diester phosphodiesterase